MTLKAFVEETKKQLSSLDTEAGGSLIHVVLGNESCDLDSAVCSVVWASYLDQSKPKDGSTVYLPVLNIPRRDFQLRTEVTYAFDKVGLSDKDLVFRDDIDLASWQERSKLKLTLVDHNVLSVADQSLDGAVVKIIDHHLKEHPENENIDMTIEPVGSCCTLVAEKVLDDRGFKMDSYMAWLLSGPILLDTVCLSPEAGRATPKDEDILEQLEKLVPDLNRKALFDELQKAKMDVGDLSTIDLLRKDLKFVTSEVETVAISSVPIHMQTLLDRPDLERDLAQFSGDTGADIIVVMSLYVDEDGTASRQLAVWSEDAAKRQQFVDNLSSAATPSLDLGEKIPCAASSSLLAFHQGNVQCSRKKVLPLVNSFFKGGGTPDSGLPSSVSNPESVRNVGDGDHTPDASQNLLDLDIFDPLSPSATGDNTADTDKSGLFSFDPVQAGTDETSLNASVNQVSNSSAFGDLLDLGPAFWYNTSASPQVQSQDQVTNNFDSLDPFANHTGILMEPSPEQGPTPEYIDTPEGVGTPDMQQSSIPGTPPNSLMGSVTAQGHIIHANNHDHALPSFHSSEMVRKIHEKKAQLELSSADFDSDFFPQVPQNSFTDGHMEVTRTVDFSGMEGLFTKKTTTSTTLEHGEALTEESSTDVHNFPFTPQNSMAESHLDAYAMDHDLPSFHSAEMVQRIEEKKASLGGMDDLPEEEYSKESAKFPFTPQNSVSEFSLDTYAQQQNLPSFHSAEMVERIREKKRSLEDIDETGGAEDRSDGIDKEADSFPYTPQNSVTESHLDSAAREHNLPSFHTAEMLDKIAEGRTDSDFSDGISGFDSGIKDAMKFPFAPPNSFTETSFAESMEKQQQERQRSALENEAELIEQLSAQSLSFTEEEDESFLGASRYESENNSADNVGAGSLYEDMKERQSSFDEPVEFTQKSLSFIEEEDESIFESTSVKSESENSSTDNVVARSLFEDMKATQSSVDEPGNIDSTQTGDPDFAGTLDDALRADSPLNGESTSFYEERSEQQGIDSNSGEADFKGDDVLKQEDAATLEAAVAVTDLLAASIKEDTELQQEIENENIVNDSQADGNSGVDDSASAILESAADAADVLAATIDEDTKNHHSEGTDNEVTDFKEDDNSIFEDAASVDAAAAAAADVLAATIGEDTKKHHDEGTDNEVTDFKEDDNSIFEDAGSVEAAAAAADVLAASISENMETHHEEVSDSEITDFKEDGHSSVEDPATLEAAAAAAEVSTATFGEDTNKHHEEGSDSEITDFKEDETSGLEDPATLESAAADVLATSITDTELQTEVENDNEVTDAQEDESSLVEDDATLETAAAAVADVLTASIEDSEERHEVDNDNKLTDAQENENSSVEDDATVKAAAAATDVLAASISEDTDSQPELETVNKVTDSQEDENSSVEDDATVEAAAVVAANVLAASISEDTELQTEVEIDTKVTDSQEDESSLVEDDATLETAAAADVLAATISDDIELQQEVEIDTKVTDAKENESTLVKDDATLETAAAAVADLLAASIDEDAEEHKEEGSDKEVTDPQEDASFVVENAATVQDAAANVVAASIFEAMTKQCDADCSDEAEDEPPEREPDSADVVEDATVQAAANVVAMSIYEGMKRHRETEDSDTGVDNKSQEDEANDREEDLGERGEEEEEEVKATTDTGPIIIISEDAGTDHEVDIVAASVSKDTEEEQQINFETEPENLTTDLGEEEHFELGTNEHLDLASDVTLPQDNSEQTDVGDSFVTDDTGYQEDGDVSGFAVSKDAMPETAFGVATPYGYEAGDSTEEPADTKEDEGEIDAENPTEESTDSIDPSSIGDNTTQQQHAGDEDNEIGESPSVDESSAPTKDVDLTTPLGAIEESPDLTLATDQESKVIEVSGLNAVEQITNEGEIAVETASPDISDNCVGDNLSGEQHTGVQDLINVQRQQAIELESPAPEVVEAPSLFDSQGGNQNEWIGSAEKWRGESGQDSKEIGTDTKRSNAQDKYMEVESHEASSARAAVAATTAAVVTADARHSEAQLPDPVTTALDADRFNTASQEQAGSEQQAAAAEIQQGHFSDFSATNEPAETGQLMPDISCESLPGIEVDGREADKSDGSPSDMISREETQDLESPSPGEEGNGTIPGSDMDTKAEAMGEYALAESITANVIQMALEVCDSTPADQVLTSRENINNVDNTAVAADSLFLAAEPTITQSSNTADTLQQSTHNDTLTGAEPGVTDSARTQPASHMAVETEYLSDIDPLKGSLDLVSGSTPLGMDAERDLAESTSFNKVAGQGKEELPTGTSDQDIRQPIEAENENDTPSKVTRPQSPAGLPLPSEQMVSNLTGTASYSAGTQAVETDYLSGVDPLGGSLGLVGSAQSTLSPDPVTDVPESTSFNQVVKEPPPEEQSTDNAETTASGTAAAAEEEEGDAFGMQPFSPVNTVAPNNSGDRMDIFGATAYGTDDPFAVQSPDPFDGNPFGADFKTPAAGGEGVSLPSDTFSSLTIVSRTDPSMASTELKPTSSQAEQDLSKPQEDPLGILAFQQKLQSSENASGDLQTDRDDAELEQKRLQVANVIVTEAMASAVQVYEQTSQTAQSGSTETLVVASTASPLQETLLVGTVDPTQTKEELPEWSEDDDDDDDGEEIKNLRDQIPEDVAMDLMRELQEAEEEEEDEAEKQKAARPNNLDSTPKKKIVPNMKDILKDEDIDLAVSHSSSDFEVGASIEDEKTPDDLTTPDALNDSVFGGELDWESEASTTPVDPIPQYTAQEELEDQRSWRTVRIGDSQYKIDLKVIEPYKKVLSHGGYYGDGFNAIIVFAACHLPDKGRRDYHYVMDNLFLYIISTLELLVVEDYMIIYFHGAASKNKVPSLRWLKRCYDIIDRRLRKNLKRLLIVHPTLWLKTVMLMTKPFISSKFSSKLRYVKSLQDLTTLVPTEYIYIPDEIKQSDQKQNPRKPIPHKKYLNL